MPTRPQYAEHGGSHAIVQTSVLDSGDELYYVPLIPEKTKREDHQKAACVRHNPEFGSTRCEACRSRSCRHVARLTLYLSRQG